MIVVVNGTEGSSGDSPFVYQPAHVILDKGLKSIVVVVVILLYSTLGRCKPEELRNQLKPVKVTRTFLFMPSVSSKLSRNITALKCCVEIILMMVG